MKAAAKIAVDVAITVAVQFAINQLTKKETKRQPGWSPIKQAVPARHYAYGRGRKRGVSLLYESVNGWCLDVLAYCHGRIGGNWEHWLHDDKVVVDVTADQAGFVLDLNGHYGANKINISVRNGLFPETAHSNITSVAGTVWTTDHRADGVATVGMRCGMIAAEKMPQVYPNGEPEHSACADWLCCYDFRKDSTSGGAGAHRRDNPATWEFTRNVVVQWVHDKLFVEGRSWGRFFANVVADLTAEANAADQLVLTAAGPEVPRYEAFIWYEADLARKSVNEMFARACDGWMVELGDGSLLFRVGRWIEPDPADVITDDMVVDLTWIGGVPKSRLYNEVQPRFANPALDYEVADTTAFRDPASITKRGRRPYVLDLQEVTNNSQAMRLAKIKLLQLNSLYRGQWVLDLDKVPPAATRNRFQRVQLANYQSSLQDVYVEFEKPEIDLVARTLTVDVRLASPSWYAWTVDEEGTGQVIVDRPDPGPPPIPVIHDVQPFDVTASTQRMRIFIRDAVVDTNYVLEWRSEGATAWTTEAPQLAKAGLPHPFIETGPVSLGGVEVRVAFVSASGAFSDWSAINGTTPRRVTAAGDTRITSAGDTRTVST